MIDFEDDEPQDKVPPKSIEVLTKAIRHIQARDIYKHWPTAMPRVAEEAAKWWVNIIEPPNPQEAPRRLPRRNGGVFWLSPYTDRLIYTFGKFIKMSAKQQNAILACREDRVYWRGETVPELMRVYDETMVMREQGIPAYRNKAMGKMRGVMR